MHNRQMSKEIIFSIVMPVWNRANIVSKAIDSVLSQTYNSYELIIVDDGSEDGLEEVVRPYLSERVFYYRISRSGVSAARNYALKHAKGDYIAYLDSDNIWHSEYLLTMLQSLNHKDPLRKAAYCGYTLYKKNSAGEMQLEGIRGEEFNFKKLLVGNYIDLNSFIHSRECVDSVGFFDENLKRLVDWDYIIRITAKFEPLFVPQVLMDYMSGLASNSITYTENYELAYNAIKLKNKAYNRSVTIWHDTIGYRWEDVPDKKYFNWLNVSQGELDKINFTANGYPYMLQIEPTNFCNLACPLCPSGKNELGRERRHLTLEEFKTVIDDLEDYLLFLVMWSWGEPFMNPELPAMIKYASAKGIKTVTSTNGQFLANESYLTELFASGLNTLIVAIDSLHEENYESYRKRGSLNRALEGLSHAIELKRKLGIKTHINMRMVIMKQNEHELVSLRAKAKMIGADRFSVKTVNPSCDSHLTDEGIVPENPRYRRYEYQENSFQRKRVDGKCGFIPSMCVIHSNGDIVPCCYDYDGTMNVGNIHAQKISEVWNGPEFRELRRKVTCNRSSLAKCKNCGINFKLSPSGWFVESINFSDERLERRLHEFGNRIEELVNEIAEMRKSLVWRMLMRFHTGIIENVLPFYTKRRKIYDKGIHWGRSLISPEK